MSFTTVSIVTVFLLNEPEALSTIPENYPSIMITDSFYILRTPFIHTTKCLIKGDVISSETNDQIFLLLHTGLQT